MKFHLRITSSSGCFYDGECESLILPTEDGEYGVMANHTSMVIGVCVGELRYRIDEEWTDAAVGQGFARVADNQVNVVVDSAERPEDIDEKRAEQAAIRARERMEVRRTRREYYRGQAALSRAMTRLKIKQNFRKPM